MFEKLKRKALPGQLVLVVLFFVIAVLLFSRIAGSLLMLLSPKDFYSLSPNELEGQYVTAKIDVIYDWYAETTRDGDTVRREYIIPVGEKEYMGVDVPRSKFDAAEAVLDSTDAVLSGKADDLDGSVLVVTGTIHEMDYQTTEFFQDTVGYYDLEPEQKALFLNLVIDPEKVGNNSRYNVLFFCITGLVLLAAATWLFVRAVTGAFLKPIRELCARQPNPDAARAALDDFYKNTEAFKNVRVDSRFLMYDNGASSWVLETPDVAWVYPTVTQHRTNGIPTGKTYCITVFTASQGARRSYTIPVKKDAGVQEMLDHLRPRLPGAVFGYSDALRDLFRADPANFASRVLLAGQAPVAPDSSDAPVSTQASEPPEATAAAAQTTHDSPNPLASAVLSGSSAFVQAAGVQAADAQQTFTFILRDAGDKKLAVVKVLHDAAHLGLAEAKELADSPYSRFSADFSSRAEAEAFVAKLNNSGASATLL